MSLLNDMLRDLNKQKQPNQSEPPLHDPSKLTLFDFVSPYSAWILMPFICCGLLLATLYHYKRVGIHTQPKVTTQVTKTITTVPDSTPIPPAIQTIPEQPTQASSTMQPIPAVPAPVPAAEQSVIKPLPSRNEDAERSFLSEETWIAEQQNNALFAIQNENDEDAEQGLIQILQRRPSAEAAREILIKLYLVQERYAPAKRILDDGLQLNPQSMPLNTLKARLLFDQDRPKEALTLLKPYHPKLRENPEFYGLMASILQSIGQFEASRKLYKKLIAVDETNNQYWLGYAIALEHQHQLAEAIQAYQRATADIDTDPTIRAYASNRLKFIGPISIDEPH